VRDFLSKEKRLIVSQLNDRKKKFIFLSQEHFPKNINILKRIFRDSIVDETGGRNLKIKLIFILFHEIYIFLNKLINLIKFHNLLFPRLLFLILLFPVMRGRNSRKNRFLMLRMALWAVY